MSCPCDSDTANMHRNPFDSEVFPVEFVRNRGSGWPEAGTKIRRPSSGGLPFGSPRAFSVNGTQGKQVADAPLARQSSAASGKPAQAGRRVEPAAERSSLRGHFQKKIEAQEAEDRVGRP